MSGGRPSDDTGSRSRFRSLLAWTALFVGGLLLAALVAPFCYAAFLKLFPGLSWPFSRIFNRTAMVIAALLLFALRRPLGWSALPALFAGSGSRRKIVQVVTGVAVALIGAVVAAGAAWALGRLGPAASSYSFFDGRTVTALVGGFVVAGIEETLFRGLMLVSLVATVGFRTAAIASSTAYALVHLLVSDPALGRAGFNLGAGFAYLAHAVGRQIELASLLPLCGLFLCGLVLAFVVRRSGTLYIAIGMHAGWAFSFQVLRHATRPLVAIPGQSYLATHHYLAGTLWAWFGVILSGALALAWIALLRPDRGGEARGR